MLELFREEGRRRRVAETGFGNNKGGTVLRELIVDRHGYVLTSGRIQIKRIQLDRSIRYTYGSNLG